MTISCKDEFRGQNFGLGFDKPRKFDTAQWRGLPDGVFIAWRVFWPLWHIGWLIRSVQSHIVDDSDYDKGESAKWFIYLTNWSYLLLTIQSIIHLLNVIHVRWHSAKIAEEHQVTNPWYNKILWVFTSISFSAAIVVTIFYWALIFEELTMALSIMTHAVTSFYVILDMFISASPVHLLHFIYPTIYGVIYVIFSLIYHFLDGTNSDGEPYIYSSLDWSDAGATSGLAVGVAFIAVPLCHLFIFVLYTFRLYIQQNCCGGVGPEDEYDAPPKAGKGEA